MAMQKRSISLDDRLATLIDGVADAENSSFSAVVSECIERAIKLRVGRLGIAAWEVNGEALDPEVLAATDDLFDRLLAAPAVQGVEVFRAGVQAAVSGDAI